MSSLDERLAAAGVADDGEALSMWRELRAVEGPTATVLDLYELVARRRGLTATDLPVEERHALGHAAMSEVWPGFGVTPGSARGNVIRVVDYDPGWPERFAAWHAVLRDALGDARIEHIGSTSVPGLAAKPIVDVQVSVDDLDEEDRYVPPLESVGLQLRSRDALHRYFRPFPELPREVHVHVCLTGSAWEAEHLRFRDILRADAHARAEYAAAKRAAAEVWADDGIAYTEAKTAVVLRILRG